jgi:hypothetical protein
LGRKAAKSLPKSPGLKAGSSHRLLICGMLLKLLGASIYFSLKVRLIVVLLIRKYFCGM